jgi:hypothetical protein
MLSRLGTIGLLLAFTAGTVACDVSVGEGGFSMDLAHGKATDTWTRTYSIEPGGRLELINVNGRIEATPGEGTSVEISAERTARAATDESARELLGKIDMREEVGPTRVRVEVRPPRSFGMSGSDVKWTVKIPAGVAADLRNTNGRVVITGLSGEIRARTVNGGVEGRRLSPTSLDASTVNGGVDVELAGLGSTEGEFSLEAVNGGVELALPGDSRASLTARVTNGGINTSGLDLEVTGEQTRRRLEGTLNGGGTRINLQTTNGGVRISRSSSPRSTS